MKKLLMLWLACSLFTLSASAQATTADTSEIYKIVDQMPRFPGCEGQGLTNAELRQCADRRMLEFVYQNVEYPQAAAETGIEGTVVTQFVVEKDGSITNGKVLRDIGAGCGAEALRVVKLMSQMREKWTPPVKDGKVERVYFTLPIKFKIKKETPIEFAMIEGDTVWTVTSTPAGYKGGEEALLGYLKESLAYPVEGVAECLIGDIELQLVIKTDGTIGLTDMVNYSELGIDFLYEAIRMIRASKGNWTPATRASRPVNSLYQVRFTFLPQSESCNQRVTDHATAVQLIDEGIQLSDSSNVEEAILKWSEAIQLFPNNGEWLALRGQAYLEQQQMDEACEDLTKANKILWRGWFSHLLPVICKAAAAEE